MRRALTYRDALRWLLDNDGGTREAVEELRSALEAAAAVAAVVGAPVAEVERTRDVTNARRCVTSLVVVAFAADVWPGKSGAIASDLVDELRRVEAEAKS